MGFDLTPPQTPKGMKASELRIGNWFLGYDNKPFQWDLECFSYLRETDIKWAVELDEIIKEPITLTEQWLVDFGAREYIGSKRSFKYSRFDLFWREDYKYWYVTDFENETYMTKIEFVHEFQNFIFAMDQEELKIKTTSSTSQ